MTKIKCNTCGKKTSAKKKVCKTKEKGDFSTFYVCQDCSKQSIRADLVCSPKEIAPSYVCKKCGSPSLKKKRLCKPKTFKV